MDFFKINYSKLENLREIKFYKLILCICICFIILLVVSCNIKIHEEFQGYGIYSENILAFNITSELSDKLKNSKYIIFNDIKTKFEIREYGKYEIINNEVYQEIKIIIDEKFYHDEVGIVKFYYDEKSIYKYILNLFR